MITLFRFSIRIRYCRPSRNYIYTIKLLTGFSLAKSHVARRLEVGTNDGFPAFSSRFSCLLLGVNGMDVASQKRTWRGIC